MKLYDPLFANGQNVLVLVLYSTLNTAFPIVLQCHREPQRVGEVRDRLIERELLCRGRTAPVLVVVTLDVVVLDSVESGGLRVGHPGGQFVPDELRRRLPDPRGGVDTGLGTVVAQAQPPLIAIPEVGVAEESVAAAGVEAHILTVVGAECLYGAGVDVADRMASVGVDSGDGVRDRLGTRYRSGPHSVES